jgi:hypothetical protein
MRRLAKQLDQLAVAAAARLRAQSPDAWPGDRGPGRWTRLEVLGHLVDSAANNHQRFVRAMLSGELAWPGYDQAGMVSIQRFAAIDPATLISLWENYNRLLAHIIANIPEDKLAAHCSIGGAPAMRLEHLVLDYVAHLEYHLRQILDDPLPFSGLPWPAEYPNRQSPE